MPVALYMDVHIPMPSTRQLRVRGVDVVTATEAGTHRLPDHELLQRATAEGRVLFTHDIRFKVQAEDWQRDGRSFAGLIYGHAEGASLGQYVRDLELIAKAASPTEMENAGLHLSL